MTLRLEVFRSLPAADAIEGAVAALNLASRRPSPFATLGYLRTFLAHDEFAEPRSEPLLLAARRGEALVGFLALKRRPRKVLGLPSVRIEFLATHDVERPGLVARAEDEAECAEAFWRHLVEREPGWSLVELMEQEATSPLAPPPWVERRGFWVRRFENNPNATLRLDYPDSKAYFKSLSQNQKRSIRHSANKLIKSGRVEVIASRDPRGREDLLRLYLDLEEHSWKRGTSAGISRHPERLRFFEALSQPGQQPELWYRFLLLDGVPLAAEMNASFAGGEYGLEVVHDEEHRDFGAANLLFLVSLSEAIAAGVRDFNLLNNFAWQKQRWGATVTDTAAIQVYRTFGLDSLKARLGELRRLLVRQGPSQRTATTNLSKPASPQAAGGRTGREQQRELWCATLSRLERDGVELQRLHGEALLSALPFRPSASEA